MPAAPTLLRTATSDQDKRLHRRPKASALPLEDVSLLKQTLAKNMPLDKHTGIYKLHLQAQATLGTSTVREAMKLPPHVDRTTWIAAKMLSILKDAELITCLLRGKVCNEGTCPCMSAGPYVQYSWADEANPEPVLLTAPEYMDRLIIYANDIISDPEIFPTDMTPSFPEDFEQLCSKLLKRIFRIYAHTYLSHFDVFQENGAEAHLNCCFKHFLFFVKEFDLVAPRDMAPLQDLVSKFEGTADGTDAANAQREPLEHAHSRQALGCGPRGRRGSAAEPGGQPAGDQGQPGAPPQDGRRQTRDSHQRRHRMDTE